MILYISFRRKPRISANKWIKSNADNTLLGRGSQIITRSFLKEAYYM